MFSSVNKEVMRRQLLSAYLDGETTTAEAQQVQSLLSHNPELQSFHGQVMQFQRAVQRSLLSDSDVDAAQERVRLQVNRTMRVRPLELAWWQRSLSVPVPFVSVAAAVVLLLAAVVAFQMVPAAEQAAVAAAPDSPRGLPSFALSDRPVNVQVTVDPSQTEELLRWLNAQSEAHQVTVQLPEQARFQFQGEPVMIRPDRSHPQEFEIVPLEDIGE